MILIWFQRRSLICVVQINFNSCRKPPPQSKWNFKKKKGVYHEHSGSQSHPWIHAPQPRLVSQEVLVTQSCPTLCDPKDCRPRGSSVSGILQARILEWEAIPFSRGSSRPRDWTWVSCMAGRCFTSWATRKPSIPECDHIRRQDLPRRN